jgi:hypothetical protein
MNTNAPSNENRAIVLAIGLNFWSIETPWRGHVPDCCDTRVKGPVVWSAVLQQQSEPEKSMRRLMAGFGASLIWKRPILPGRCLMDKTSRRLAVHSPHPTERLTF